MSLRLWLPMIGNMQNQGIEDVSGIISPNVTYADGKLGKCASFNGASSYVMMANNILASDTGGFSVCCWLKLNSTGRNETIMTCRTDVGVGIAIFKMSADNFRFDAGKVEWYTSSYTSTAWNHVCFTRNASGKYIYINGTLVVQSSDSDDMSNIGTHISIGASSSNGSGLGNWFSGSMNDFRIYDHALSAREVKEISKGLLLHYPLCQLDKPMCNIAIDTNQGDTRWAWSLQVGNYTKSSVIENGINCCKLTRGDISLSGWSFIHYSGIQPSVYKSGEKYTVSFEIKPSIATSIRFLLTQGNALNPLTGWSAIFAVKANEWNKLYNTFSIVAPLPSSIGEQVLYLTNMNSSVGVSYMFRNLKIEEGVQHTQWCPAFEDSESWFNGIEYDCSGFGNNGLVTSATAPSWSNNSRKYQGCYNFIKYNNYIVSEADDIRKVFNSGTFTASMWITPSNLAPDVPSCIVTCRTANLSNNTDKQFYLGIHSDHLILSYYADDHNIMYNFKNGNTYHIACSSNGLHVLFYINGEEIVNVTPNSVPQIPENAKLCIGLDVTRSSAQYYGHMSDFRIYATALSDEDVKSLYNTRYSLANNGTFIVGGICEDDNCSAASLGKEGIATAVEFNELIDNGNGNYTENSNLNISSTTISAKEFIEI